MGIKKDAGELLIYYYDQYASGHVILRTLDVIAVTNWEPSRINNAIRFLKDSGQLDIQYYLGNTNGVGHFEILGMTSLGIQVVEDDDKFKHTFGIKLNLAIVELSWNLKK